jgi:hypothetical protein
VEIKPWARLSVVAGSHADALDANSHTTKIGASAMFNDDQRDYMRSLGKLSNDERCWCAWYRVNECPNCPPGKTLTMRLAVQCPERLCQNYPSPHDPDGKIIHNICCPTRAKLQQATA